MFRTFTTTASSADTGVLQAALHRIERAMWYKLCKIEPIFTTESIRADVDP